MSAFEAGDLPYLLPLLKAVEKEVKKELEKEVGVAWHDQMMLQLLSRAGSIVITKI
jgi:hypothetical protein